MVTFLLYITFPALISDSSITVPPSLTLFNASLSVTTGAFSSLPSALSLPVADTYTVSNVASATVTAALLTELPCVPLLLRMQ